MVKSLPLEFFYVSLDRLEFFKGKYACLVKTDKEIGILPSPYILASIFHDQKFHCSSTPYRLHRDQLGHPAFFTCRDTKEPMAPGYRGSRLELLWSDPLATKNSAFPAGKLSRNRQAW